MQTEPEEILKKYWGYDTFRPLQKDIISSVLSGKDTLGLLPTGGGKSICFQVPALMLEGFCLVVTPLIALMKDQVENLANRDIPAIALYSGMHREEIEIEIENARNGKYKLLYVSPERLAGQTFQSWLPHLPISFIAIDEAHCISQWGYDFRPEYLKIADVKEFLPSIKFLALTASATPKVVNDIQNKLLFKTQNVFSKSFVRNNLSYVVIEEENKRGKILNICKKIAGTGIVYTRNRKLTKELSIYLRQHGISADFYHAGLDMESRNRKQEEWKNGKTRIMVCTNAFGMGIDKPDVRFVIHEQKPESLEAYYQEAGRAGRDEKKSWCVLLFHPSEFFDEEKELETKFPTPAELNSIYQATGNYLGLAVGAGEGSGFDFEISAFSEHYRLNPLKVHHALKLLAKLGYLEITESVFNPPKIRILIPYKELYNILIKNPNIDNLMKIILRSYGGVFDHYISFNESNIAAKAKIGITDVKKLLEQLHSKKIIDYIPRKDKPQLVFNDARYAKINVNTTEIEQLKQRYIEQTTAVKKYVTNKNICRSRLLVDYFGDKETKNCGLCDVCIEKEKSLLTEESFNTIVSEIKTILTKKELTANELYDAMEKKPLNEVKIVTRWLLDHGKIIKTDKGLMKWERIE